MGLLEWISRKLQLFSRRPHKVPLSNLELLPLELLLLITNFLTTTDIICVSLCSRTLKYSTTNLCEFKPLHEKSLALSVLTRLARDLPQMYCCHYCAKLHRITDVRHPACTEGLVHKECPDLGLLSQKGEPLPSLRWYASVHCFPSRYQFHHCHLVAVLQNHYCGDRYGINAETLAYTEVVDYLKDPAITTLLSVEGRVCEPAAGSYLMASLVLQIQQWVLFDDFDIVSDRDFKVTKSVLKNTPICGSQTLGTPEIMDEIRSAIRQRSFCLDELSAAAKCMQCSVCGVEFEVAFRDCGKDGKAVIVTEWLELGAGMDIQDPKWKKKADFVWDNKEYTHQFGHVVASSGEARRLFRESSDQESDPTPRNESYLMGRRYRRAMWENLDSKYYLLRH